MGPAGLDALAKARLFENRFARHRWGSTKTRQLSGSSLLHWRPHMRIANVEIPSGIFLAPMEAVTDLPFRTV